MDLLKKVIAVLVYQDEDKDLYDLVDSLYTFKADNKTMVGRIIAVSDGVSDLPMIEVSNRWFPDSSGENMEILAILLCPDKSARLYFRKPDMGLDFMKGSYIVGTIEIENYH